MLLDTNKPLGSQYATTEDMRQAMVAISTHTQDRGKQVEWADHLKFLTPFRKSESPGQPISEDYCSCVAFDAAFFAMKERELRLTAPGDTPECTHYFAVSYCWSSSAESRHHGRPFSITRQDGSTNPPSCPESLLDRVIQFACGKGMSFIWIDQECIDQNDELDKTVGIQAMDLVYQRAEYSIAVLEVCITEQRHLDALEWILEFRPDDDDHEALRDACEALQIIMSDPWFERAWCLQESVSGCRRMTLLIRYNPDLIVSNLLQSEVDDCFEIELPVIHGILLSALQSRIAVTNPFQLDSSIRNLCLEVIEEWSDKMPPDDAQDVDDQDFDYHTACNAAAALHYLSRRYNSVISDRLAIMANLCDFETRLDGLALDELGFGFGICAVVLAVINGDMSILTGCDDFNAMANGGRKDIMVASSYVDEARSVRPFSWMLPNHARLDRVSYFDVDADADLLRVAVNSNSLKDGLEIDGCLWTADHVIDLSAFVADFEKSWPQDIIERMWNIDDDFVQISDSIFEPARVDLLLKLLCELSDRGYEGLLQLLWDHFRLQTLNPLKHSDEVQRYMKASFEEIIEVKSRTVRWPNPRPHSNRKYKREHPFQDLGQRTLMNIAKPVLQGRLLIARPISSDDSNASYSGFFGLQQEGATIFTPSLSTPPRYGWYPSNWVVREVGTQEQRSLTVEGTACGIWACEEAFCGSVTLV